MATWNDYDERHVTGEQTSFRDTRPTAKRPQRQAAVCIAGFRKHQFSDYKKDGIRAAEKCLRCGAPNPGR